MECTIGNGLAPAWPDITTLNMASGGVSLSWPQMRVVGSPRVRSGKMRVILEDSRWKLRYAIFPFDFNRLDSSGVSFTPSQATMAQLAGLFGSNAGIPLVAGGSVPSFTPPAPWRGMVAYDALKHLLHDSICRLHYSPGSGVYSIWAKGTGSLPSLSNRLFISSPNRGIRNIFVRSSPVLFEQSMTATAVVENGQGALVNVASNFPNEYVSGFPSVTDEVLKTKLKQGAFRFWRINNNDRNVQNHRGLSMLSSSGDVKYLGIEMVHSDLAGQMQEHILRPVSDLSQRDESGRQVYYTETPFLESNGGSFKTTADVIASYYLDVAGEQQRQIVSRAVSGVGQDRAFNIDWVRPLISNRPDVPATQWLNYLNAVADSLQTALQPNPHTVTLPGLVPTPPSGRIGAVEYHAELAPDPNVLTRLALDFDANPRDLT